MLCIGVGGFNGLVLESRVRVLVLSRFDLLSFHLLYVGGVMFIAPMGSFHDVFSCKFSILFC